MVWRDSSGKTLADYPRPSLAVDVALLTVVDGGLAVLLHRGSGYAQGKWVLPGTFVRLDETLDDAALRALAEKAGVSGESPVQLCVVDAVDRDERGRVVSVAHVDLVPASRLSVEGHDDVVLAPIEGERVVVPGRQQRLPYDHDEIVTAAVRWARAEYTEKPDPRGLLGETFTLYELRKVHEAVLGGRETPGKDTFRRRMESLVVGTGKQSSGTVGRPAELFTRMPTGVFEA